MPVLRPVSRFLPLLLVTLLTHCAVIPCAAEDDESLRVTISQLADPEAEVRTAAVETLARLRDPRILAVLEHYKKRSLLLWEGQLVLCPEMQTDDDGNRVAPLQDVLTGEPIQDEDGKPRVVLKSETTEVLVRRPERRALEDAIRVHELFAEDLDRRLSAVQRLGLSNNPEFIKYLEDVLAADNPAPVRHAAEEGIWLLKLGDPEGSRDSWIEAAGELARLHSSRGSTRLVDKVKAIDQLQADGKSADLELRDFFQQQVTSIKTYQERVGQAKNIFNGISTGSVLVLIALGLAIIFGQMGVINMAHGELVMLGAYATYVTQLLFGHTPEDPNNWFFVAALPISFMVAAFAGLLIEFLVVRHLYKRPLESLLATWGVGLILIQFIRAGFPWAEAEWASELPDFLRWGGFGDNIGVNSPTWLVGAVNPMTDMALPYNRLFIIGLTIVSVAGIAIMMRYTRLGLRIRATVQNRETAASLGVNTRRTDSYTFAIGSGLAGIAGYALTLIAGVTPDMGQNYIVDSFLVVVTGGVGKLSGSVAAGTGIGVMNKFFEPITFGGALFSVGLFVLVACWIRIVIRARRSKKRQWVSALALPPLYVFQNRKQRGLVKLLVFSLAGVLVMLLVSRASFDHMVVIRGEGSDVVAGHRLVISDMEGTRKVFEFAESKSASAGDSRQVVVFEKTPATDSGTLAVRLAVEINESGLQGVWAVADEDRVILRGSQEVIFTSGQESLGLAWKTPEGFRSKPAQVASRLPAFGEFLAIPVRTIWGKVFILIVVMLFIQWQPAGLFPPRGRLADE
ncbi:MAG: urea ABC transporter permease subunit UrtB [Planctomycetota bacterium]|nr:urea ABC transporter permease subunit UrtB [Planctomycetota bacterium]